jgi:hypothetical protein
MTYLSPEDAKVLRIALGLDVTNKHYPSRNKLHPVYAERHKGTVTDLIGRGFLTLKVRDGEAFYIATDAGRVAVIDHPWKD